ncbi:hypothetical protein M0R45_036097 [Rubus argutus]|uniref:Phytocyanin domain-containing protein n=1 Tax=Rubus argutus TaxID=59490 RepID=A0AAW1VW31_RUBAR
MSYKNALVIGFSLILVTLLLQCQEIHGKEFLVGDEKGWSPYPGISDWPNGKNFTPGDVLIFKYDNTSTKVWQADFILPEYLKDCYDLRDM